MSWPGPTRDHHQEFCTVEKWDLVFRPSGAPIAHHVTYELRLVDGRILRTRISRPVDRTTYGRSIWSHILRDQLEVEAEQFWACVLRGIPPDRGLPEPPLDAIPANLVNLLIRAVGMPEDDVRRMTKQQAIDRINEYWTTGR